MNAVKIYLSGNTFPVKEALKSLGCRWDAERKSWYATSEEMAEKAREVIAGKGTASRTCASPREYRP